MAQPFYGHALVNGKLVVTSESWWLEGSKLHRMDGPASRTWQIVDELPVLTYESWCVEGNYHRVDGPAIQQWEISNGLGYDVPVLTYEVWYVKGELHRVDGPSRKRWEITKGQPFLTSEEWSLQGEYHRVEGPALAEWKMENDLPVCEAWYLEGKRVEPIASPFVRELTTHHLQACGLMIWPGLMGLITSYLV